MLASAFAWRPPAPPKATSANSLGTRPRWTVTTRSAPSIASSTMLTIARAVSSTPVPRASATCATAANAASASSSSSPPSRRGGRWPRTTLASVTVASVPPAAVAGGAWKGARALRADSKCSGRVRDVRDRAAAGADARDVDRRRAHGKLADVRLARDLGASGHADRNVRGRPTHVEREDAVEARVGRDERRAADAAGRPRQHSLYRAPAGRLKAHQAAVRPHDLDRRPHVRGGKPVTDVDQVLLEDRRDVRVHQRRHRALVLAELGQDLGGDRHREVGGDGGGDVGDDALVAAVGMRVEQADGQRLDPSATSSSTAARTAAASIGSTIVPSAPVRSGTSRT